MLLDMQWNNSSTVDMIIFQKSFLVRPAIPASSFRMPRPAAARPMPSIWRALRHSKEAIEPESISPTAVLPVIFNVIPIFPMIMDRFPLQMTKNPVQPVDFRDVWAARLCNHEPCAKAFMPVLTFFRRHPQLTHISVGGIWKREKAVSTDSVPLRDTTEPVRGLATVINP